MEIIYEMLNIKEIGIFLFLILGLCLGSFFNVYALRYNNKNDAENKKEVLAWLEEKSINPPAELIKDSEDYNLSYPASHCYSCGKTLKWYHNIPLISYILLGGKCGFCKSKISIQYPLVELMGGMLSVFSYIVFYKNSNILILISAYIFIMSTYLLALIDFKTMYLPDEINYFLLWVGLTSSIFNFNPFGYLSAEKALLGIMVGYFSLGIISFIGKKIKGYEVMGGGDLKLLAAIGGFLGPIATIETFFLAPFIGIFFWGITKISKAKGTHIPYGPSLIIASYVIIVFGDSLIKFII